MQGCHDRQRQNQLAKSIAEIGNKKNTMTVIADITKEAEVTQRNRSDDQFI